MVHRGGFTSQTGSSSPSGSQGLCWDLGSFGQRWRRTFKPAGSSDWLIDVPTGPQDQILTVYFSRLQATLLDFGARID